MTKRFKHIFDNTNILYSFSVIFILIFYLYHAFKGNYYEIIFMDERLLIDDIYNVWLLEDSFNRFQNTENNIYKSILILLTELSYGGDLRYGRLWSNIFTLINGPFVFISDRFVITSTRIVNILIFMVASYLITKIFLQGKFVYIGILIIYSIPGIELLNRFPKPEVLALLFLAIGLNFFKKKRYELALFWIGVSSFLKINFIVFLLIFSFYLFIRDDKKFKFLLKKGAIIVTSLLFVNPALIIPPIEVGGYKIPNFYIKYYNWILSQGSYGQDNFFSIKYFTKWAHTLNEFYKVPNNFQFFIITIIFLMLVVLIFKSYKRKEVITTLLLTSVLIYFLFYFFFIERQFYWYLTTPLIFLTIIFVNEMVYKTNYFAVIIFLVFSIIGLTNNFYQHINEKTFTANYLYGYEDITTEDDAVMLTDTAVKIISEIYLNNKHLEKNLVYWNPNLFMPRFKVTYEEAFTIREYWDSGNIEEILEISDIYVTYIDFDRIDINSINFQNLYFYYK